MKPFTVHTYARINVRGQLVVSAWTTFQEHATGEHLALRLCAKNYADAVRSAKAARRLMEERKSEARA